LCTDFTPGTLAAEAVTDSGLAVVPPLVRGVGKRKLRASSKNCAGKMPPLAVLDSTILMSAFLTPGGTADAVLHLSIEGQFTCCLAEEIIEETARRLRSPRLQER
jgi:hypothetical protein